MGSQETHIIEPDDPRYPAYTDFKASLTGLGDISTYTGLARLVYLVQQGFEVDAKTQDVLDKLYDDQGRNVRSTREKIREAMHRLAGTEDPEELLTQYASAVLANITGLPANTPVEEVLSIMFERSRVGDRN